MFLLSLPSALYAAEVLQVNSSSLLQIGDNNRNYKVRLACLEVDEINERKAFDYLKSQLPRKTKINFFPKGSENGILIARVSKISDGSKDLSLAIVEEGLGSMNC